MKKREGLGRLVVMTTQLDLGWFDPHLRGLHRAPAEGVGSGLSHAIAHRLGVDVVLVRVVFVVLAFCAGLGLALYAWGTVLSRGPQGTRPIDQVLPGFRTWAPGLQKVLIILSTVIVTGTLGAAFPLPWGAGLLVLIALLVWRRRSLRHTSWQPPAQHRATVAAPGFMGAPLDDQSLVDQWRRSISEAVGTRRTAIPGPYQLPEVDLYNQVEERPTQPAGPAPKANWWAGLGVLTTMALAAWVAVNVLFLTGIESLAVTTGAGGFVAVTLALFARRWHLPRVVMAVVAVPTVLTGWLAVQTTALPPADSTEVYTVSVMADNAVVDLTDVDLSGYSTVRLDALLANVELILPAPAESTTLDTWASEVTYVDGRPADMNGVALLPIDLEINARLANLTIQEQS